MMKNNIFLRLSILVSSVIILISCKSFDSNNTTEKCYENLYFKKIFFKNIENVDFYINKKSSKRHVNDKRYKKSMKFLSKYVQISYYSMANYAGVYPYAKFKEDRSFWFKWYEQNKCKKVKTKESHYRIDSTKNSDLNKYKNSQEYKEYENLLKWFKNKEKDSLIKEP